MVKIAPSVLSLDFTQMKKQMDLVNKHADWIHFDVMDGHFVPNISYGPKILEEIQKVSNLFCDVHIMVSNPFEVAQWFVEANANLITFHIEAVKDSVQALELIKYIQSKKVKVGISIKPNTEVSEIEMLLSEVDLVLVMSVEPGFGGQEFIENSLEKIAKLKALRAENNYNYVIEVDGGINDETAKLCVDAGVDILVAGSYIFKGDIVERINSLK